MIPNQANISPVSANSKMNTLHKLFNRAIPSTQKSDAFTTQIADEEDEQLVRHVLGKNEENVEQKIRSTLKDWVHNVPLSVAIAGSKRTDKSTLIDVMLQATQQSSTEYAEDNSKDAILDDVYNRNTTYDFTQPGEDSDFQVRRRTKIVTLLVGPRRSCSREKAS